MTEGLRITTEAGALRITMDRPGHLNALTADMADRVAEEVERAAVAEDVRVSVLAGTGPAFSAGADLSGEDAHENFDVTSLDRANRIIRAMTKKPVRRPMLAPATSFWFFPIDRRGVSPVRSISDCTSLNRSFQIS